MINENTGELGWLDSRIRCEAYEPIAYAYGLAHDCIEHFAFDSVADEIMAHGAMYWVRYEGGWSHPENGFTLEMNAFATEWLNLYRGLEIEGYLPTPPKTRALDSCIENDITEIREQGSRMICNEFPDDDGRGEATYRIANVFRAYFRLGYRKARKQYKNVSACEVANLYNMLADSFKHNRPVIEGQEMTVSVNPRTGEIKIRLPEYA